MSPASDFGSRPPARRLPPPRGLPATTAWLLVAYCSSAVIAAAWMALGIRWPGVPAAAADPADFTALDPPDFQLASLAPRPTARRRAPVAYRPVPKPVVRRPLHEQQEAPYAPSGVRYNAMATWREDALVQAEDEGR